MEYNIRYLQAAKDNIRDIEIYLSQFYPSTAVKALQRIETCVTNLITFPYMYEAYAANPFYRKFTAGNYIAFYHVDEVAKVVEIHRVLRASADLPRHLEDGADEE
jgi:plasmid stabilization system protein ParE